MALSMEEERILTEIASQLSEDDPVLARRFARFGRVRRRRHGRARLVVAVALAAVVVAAAVAVAVVIVAT
jgi:cytoskeletal protein RodZ